MSDEHMSGWVTQANLHGIDSSYLEETKSVAIRRLRQSGLPTFDFYFHAPNSSRIKNTFQKLPNNVTRICHKTNPTKRRTLINMSLEDALKQIKRYSKKSRYEVIINTFEPVTYSGAIISNANQTIIEVDKAPHLNNLSHGKVNPFSAIYEERLGTALKLHHLTNTPIEVRELMWKSLKSITTKGEMRRGYFEFVQTDEGIKFVDYNPNLQLNI